MNRVEFISHVSEETMLPIHEVENALNSIFANLKTMLPEEEIRHVAENLDADDLRNVWETASLPKNDDD